MSNDFTNEDNQTLENSETGDPSQIENETQGSTEQAQESIRYMQSEKDKAMAENAKLRQEIESIKDHLASSTQKDNRVDIKPDDFEPWESFTDPNSKSYKYRMQETANLVKSMVDNELQGVKQEQATNQLESQLRARGMNDEQINGFFKFANTPVSELGIDNVIKMYNSVNETTARENNLDTVRRTQQAPSTAGVLQGQQPEKKSEVDNMWDGIVSAGSRTNVLK